jgi:hypothetical protein
MDMGSFSLFIKMVKDQYKLDESEILILTNRLLADDREFEKVWKLFKMKGGRVSGGVDQFKSLLNELIA